MSHWLFSRPTQTTPRPRAEFRDGAGLPVMVVIPPGEFMMGSPANEIWSGFDERPVRRVQISAWLAVGKYPVTLGEFSNFVKATGHDMSAPAKVWDGAEYDGERAFGWLNPGFAQTDAHPVTCVNRFDAIAYAAWVSEFTGHAYRLLSEAEWEYACRAGSPKAFAFGDTITTDHARFDPFGEDTPIGTSPVGAYPPNAFGLHDMHGNVWEWCADHYRLGYAHAHSNGEAWLAPQDKGGVLRGGSFDERSDYLRSASRNGNDPCMRLSLYGFRVVRVLNR